MKLSSDYQCMLDCSQALPLKFAQSGLHADDSRNVVLMLGPGILFHIRFFLTGVQLEE